MSRATPRKSRHRHSASGGGGGGGGSKATAVATDYESDAAQYMEARVDAPQVLQPNRTNTEINLKVLQRYLPSIQSIASIAANAVVYTFDPATNAWDKSGVEGTMFVCDQEPLSLGGSGSLPRSCVFVLNRRALENVIIDLAVVNHYEISAELLMFRLEQPAEKVLGLWIHADQDDTRQSNASIIEERWKGVRDAGEVAMGPQHGKTVGAIGATEESLGPAMQAIGRKLSLSDLFGRTKDAAHDPGP
ncbi:hypothetical protein RB594_008572 [Gaeumannomyces avenae]